MNYGVVLRVLGIILVIESALMIPSYVIALYSNQGDDFSFLITIILTLFVGAIFARKKKVPMKLKPRDGFAIVTFGWILVSFFGALPLFISNSTNTFIDAFFEIVSGFSTTGATILNNVESLPNGILFWRSFTHWIGGMGILVFTLALLPALGISGFHIFKAESPGPIAGKIAPRLKDTAKILYITYFTLTILEVIFLLLGGMSLFDSFVYSFGTLGTGGFGTKNNSIGAYDSTYIQLVIGTFMLLAGVNFSLYYAGFKGKIRNVFKDEELKMYFTVIVGAVILIALNLITTNYDSIGLAFKDAYFQVNAIISTTGFSTVDFNQWPSFSKGILLILMFMGGTAGSTAGGIKVIRILIILKLIKREVGKLFHPRAVMPIKLNGKVIPNEVIAGINSYLSLYAVILAICTLLVSLEGIDLLSAATSVVSTLSNIGPGLEFVGPASNFSGFSQITKLLFSFLMLLGRLELFTVIALFAPRTWRKRA